MIKLRVREVAERAGVKDAAQLSRRADIATETAYRIWDGDAGSQGRGVGINTLYRIAKALGVKTSDLYDEDQRTPRLATA